MLKLGSGKHITVTTVEDTSFTGFVKSFDDEKGKLDIDAGGGLTISIDYNIIKDIKEINPLEKSRDEIIYADSDYWDGSL